MAEQQNVQNVQEPDLNQLRKVRREKLAELQGNGKDPFQITKYDQDAHSQSIKDNFEELEGKKVSVESKKIVSYLPERSYLEPNLKVSEAIKTSNLLFSLVITISNR